MLKREEPSVLAIKTLHSLCAKAVSEGSVLCSREEPWEPWLGTAGQLDTAQLDTAQLDTWTPGHPADRAMLVSSTFNRRGYCPCLSLCRDLLLLQASLSLQNVINCG